MAWRLNKLNEAYSYGDSPGFSPGSLLRKYLSISSTKTGRKVVSKSEKPGFYYTLCVENFPGIFDWKPDRQTPRGICRVNAIRLPFLRERKKGNEFSPIVSGMNGFSLLATETASLVRLEGYAFELITARITQLSLSNFGAGSQINQRCLRSSRRK